MEFVNASKFKDKGISFSSGSFGINLVRSSTRLEQYILLFVFVVKV